MNKIITFLKEVRVELSKVSWPTRKETTTYTLTVIAITLSLAIFLGALDSGFAYIINLIVK
jgi:preprotein translocase subunit SecE